MIHNALLSSRIFPDWRVVVFHDDTVPPVALDDLRGLDCLLVDCAGRRESGMFWRLLIASRAERWICRDADSRLGTRDAVAVSEWEASGNAWHIVRDCVHHTSPVLTGLMGGYRTGDLIERRMAEWDQFGGRFDDQAFVISSLLANIRRDCFTHDFDNPIPYPRDDGAFLGQIIDTHGNPR